MLEADQDEADSSRTTDLSVLILAAGQSTRMRSATNKVMHDLAGVPVLEHVLRAAESLAPDQIIVVTRPDACDIRNTFSNRASFAVQAEPLGTADAVAAALPHLIRSTQRVLILYGDVPLVRSETLDLLVSTTRQEAAIIGLLTFALDDPGSYGRVQVDASNRITGVIEAADDSSPNAFASTLNSGIYCVDAQWLIEHLPNIKQSNSGEYYLTDIVAMAAENFDGANRVVSVAGSAAEFIGVDDRVKLAQAGLRLRERINLRHLRGGVTLIDPDRTYIDVDVQIGTDTLIEPGVLLKGNTVIGGGSRIESGSTITDSVLGELVVVRHSSIESSSIGDRVDIGPFAHIRPETTIQQDAHIGNFVETKHAMIGQRTKIGHFSYIGDATLGSDVNIGAGTITCNYDGELKQTTTIGDDAFIGCDTMLVAPVTVGKGARTGAGAVVTRDVSDGSTVVGMPARAMDRRRRTEAS